MSAINKAGTGVNINQISLDPPPKTTTKQKDLVSSAPVDAGASERLSKTAELAQTNAQIKERITNTYRQQNAGASGANNVNSKADTPLARAMRLIDIRGTANEQDGRLVAAELSRLPVHVLQRLETKRHARRRLPQFSG